MPFLRRSRATRTNGPRRVTKGTLRQLRAVLVGLALTTLAAVWVAPATAQTKAPPPVEPAAAVPAGNAANGKVLYGKIGCYQCHSEQGQGGTQGPRLGPRPISYQAFLRYLRSPRGEMPPYKVKVMSDQDVAYVYAFLQALPPPPPLSRLPLLQP
jgi:mono/diheme cytochrome c family protein